MNYIKETDDFAKGLNKSGVFLTAGNDKPNTMTIGWGFSGKMWEKHVIIVAVRPSRYTHNLIDLNKEFSVSVPLDNSMNKQLGFFGSVSGYDTDKYKEQGIIPQKCKSINTVIIPGNCCHIECKLIYKNEIIKEKLDTLSKNKWYGDNSFHTMFYGEIVDAYYTK